MGIRIPKTRVPRTPRVQNTQEVQPTFGPEVPTLLRTMRHGAQAPPKIPFGLTMNYPQGSDKRF